MNIFEDPYTSGRSRHGCVATWLILMIFVNSLTAVAYLLFSEKLLESYLQGASTSIILLYGGISLLNIFFAIMLWQYKVLGFYGYVISSIAVFVLNLIIGLGVLQSISGLVAVAVLYGILQIKDREIPVWEHLE